MRKILILVLLLLLPLIWALNKYGYLVQNIKNIPRSVKVDTNPVSIKVMESDPKLDFINLPSGFKINYFADNVPGARSLTRGTNGVIYVGTRNQGVVYALEDLNNDGKAEQRFVVASGLNAPNGVAYHSGDLYVAEATRIIKFNKINESYKTKPGFDAIYSAFPKDAQHSWKYLAIGPDNKLYVPIGMPCNICQKKDPYGSILRLNLDGSNPVVIARGIRNTVGFDWNPTDSSLWFTDNGRDNLGDDIPPDELNRIQSSGQNFGFPYCHAGYLLDPEFGKGKNCSAYVSPVQVLGPHVASLGIKFYRGDMFPTNYKNMIFIAEHGSWNRTVPTGYRITNVDVSNLGVTKYSTFASGWLDQGGKTRGRPVDVLELPDGSLLLSDDYAGVVYRITYEVQ